MWDLDNLLNDDEVIDLVSGLEINNGPKVMEKSVEKVNGGPKVAREIIWINWGQKN